ncbi:MAG: GAF domain-containing protein [Anaerolineales bacterium]|nr:GAF domain-containing protein [Anaerolineales bacterium]
MSTTFKPANREWQLATPALSTALLLLSGGLLAYGAVAAYLAWAQTAALLWGVAGAAALTAAAAGISALLVRRGRRGPALALMLAGFALLLLAADSLAAGLGVPLALMAPILAAALATGQVGRRALWAIMLAAAAVSGACVLLDAAANALLPFRVVSGELTLVTSAAAALLAALYVLALLRGLADLSLRAKLIIAFLAVTLLPLAGLAALNERASRQALTAAANEALRGAAAQTALSLDTFFDNTRGIVQGEAQQPVVRAFLLQPPDARPGSRELRELRTTLALWQRRDTRANSYLLLDATGTVVLATSSLDMGANFADQNFFVEALNTGQSYVSPIRFEPNDTRGNLYFSMVVRGPDSGEVLGVLAARYTARVVQDLLEKTNGLAGTDSFGAVVDENLMYVAYGTDDTLDFRLVGPSDEARVAGLQALYRLPNFAAYVPSVGASDLANDLLLAGRRPYFSTGDVSMAARESQAAVVPLTTFPWQVVFFQPQDVFLAPVEQQTQATLTLAAVIALIVTGAAVGAAQLLADPLVRLTATADKVAGGDLTVQAEVTSQDETGQLARSFNTMTIRLNEMVATLEQRVVERTGQLQAAADISRATASVRNLDDLLRLALELIRERFGYYHASIFLLDAPGQYALLRESTGPVGAQLKARGHRLAVGSQSLIGWVTANRKARVALDVAEDPFHFKNPLLPDTRSELAIPLVVGDQLLGALDVQSRTANAFGEGDVRVLQTLADQLSVAIQNAQLFAQSQASLDEMRGLYQRIAGNSWRTLTQGGRHEAVYEQAGQAAPAAGEPLNSPLVLRDRTVGVMEIYGRPPGGWSAEERAALGTIATEAASALESAALLEETQRRRVREQVINEITYQMRATLNPTAVVQSGMRELGRALGATEVVVRLAGEAGPTQPGREEPSA